MRFQVFSLVHFAKHSILAARKGAKDHRKILDFLLPSMEKAEMALLRNKSWSGCTQAMPEQSFSPLKTQDTASNGDIRDASIFVECVIPDWRLARIHPARAQNAHYYFAVHVLRQCDALEGQFAAIAVTLRGINIDRAFITLGP